MDDLFGFSSAAVISDCGAYRYWLERRWGPGPTMTFVMLNPSTADASLDDPTIRRCIGFAKRENCGGLVVVNCFAFRATDPDALRGVIGDWRDGVVGAENEKYLHEAITASDGPVVCAWGAFGKTDPGHWVTQRYRDRGLWCLGTTKDGRPKHPLYIAKGQPLIPFPARPTTGDTDDHT